MRKVLLPFVAAAVFVSFGLSGRILAADVPAPVYKAAPAAVTAHSWSGFYAGIHGGYGWADGRTDIGINDPSGVTQLVAADGGFPLSYSFDRNGYIAGGQIGFNQQISQWLWGVEADISATGMKGSSTVFTPQCPNFCGGPSTSTVTQDMDWFGTVRGRLGWVSGQWLFYGTGGLAYGHVKYSYLETNAPFGGPLTIAASGTNIEVGWTAGGGIEYGFGQWSFRAEYLYFDLGKRTFTAPNPLAPPALGVALLPTFHNTGSIARAALNYRFTPQ
jgi:outer membrane immunogenic protein